MSRRSVAIAGCVASLACGAGVAGAQPGASGEAGAHLYWTTGRDVVEANLDGTNATTIHTESSYFMTDVAVGGGRLYWAVGGANGFISEANLDGTNSKRIVARKSGGRTTGMMAFGYRHLYWTTSAGALKEARANGSGVTEIFHSSPNVASPVIPLGVAVAGHHLYWSEQGRGKIIEANLDGTHAKTIAKHQSNPVGVAVGGGHLYWTTLGDRQPGTIVEANLDGTGAKTIVTGAEPSSVAVGDGHLYWFNDAGSNGSGIVEANLDGTGAKAIANPRSGATALAIEP